VHDKQKYNCSQFTNIWHVVDLMISHVDTNVIEGIIRQLNTNSRQENPITLTRGEVLEYLRMLIVYTTYSG